MPGGGGALGIETSNNICADPGEEDARCRISGPVGTLGGIAWFVSAASYFGPVIAAVPHFLADGG